MIYTEWMPTNIHVLLVFQKLEQLRPKKEKIVIVAHRTNGIRACSAAQYDGQDFIDFNGRRLERIDAWAHMPRHFDDIRRW